MSDDILVRREDWCLHITLNRPEVRNALSEAMWNAIEHAFVTIRNDRRVRAVVLRGAGNYFCAGADLRERRGLVSQNRSDQDPVLARSIRSGQLLNLIDQAPQAVITVVEGGALGGGFGLVCVSDIALATKNASFGLPEATLGIPPAQIMPYLVRRIGPALVRRLTLTAARFDGEEAARLGVVDEVCTDATVLDRRLDAILSEIDRCSAGAIAASKQLMHAMISIETNAYIEKAAHVFAACARSPEGLEGAAAFRDKRAPEWRMRV